jgi:para-nitrobenzyl esterase
MRASLLKIISLFAVFFLGTQQVLAQAPAPVTQRSTPSGNLIGSIDTNGTYRWQGIPYAQPPVGSLRWRATMPAAPWPGVLQAITPRGPCIQLSAVAPMGTIGSEDCLYLNIWTPPLSAEQINSGNIHLPVMVWVAGDGNVAGNGNNYNGSILAKSQNVIVVTMNYRLGVFGWFRNPALFAVNVTPEDRSGNYGTLDQIQVLRWTKQNIAAFGGDPNRITIFGESAGGSNVLSLLVAPAAKPLINRAMAQSSLLQTVSIPVAQNYRDDPNAGANTSSGEVLLQLLIDDGLASDRATAKAYVANVGPAAIATYLYSKTFLEFAAAYLQLTPPQTDRPYIEVPPQLIRDGTVLPAEGIGRSFLTGNYAHVPLVLGSTRDEYTSLLSVVGAPIFVQGDPLTGQITVPDKPRYYLAAEYLSRLYKATGVDELATTLFWQQPGQVFAYRFDWDNLLPAPFLDNISLGATHGLPVAFEFQQLNLGPEFAPLLALINPASLPSFYALSDKMQSYWGKFVYTGDPDRGQQNNLTRWKPWGSISLFPPAINTSLILDEPAGGGIRMISDIESRAEILHDLATDPRLEPLANRCRFAFDLWSLRTGVRINKFEYMLLLNGQCQQLMPLPPSNIQGDRDPFL